MRLRRVLEALLGVSVACFLVLLAGDRTRALDHSAEAAYARELRAFEAADTRLNEDLLRSRSGLVGHYDAIAGDLAELRRSSRTASRLPASIAAARDPFLAELGRAEALLQRKDELLERFRMQHSTLRNSRHVVPAIASRLTAPGSNDPSLSGLTHAVAEVQIALSRLDLKPHDSPPFERQLAALEAARPLARAARVGRDLARLIDHVSIIAEREPLVDALVREALAVPLDEQVDALAEAHAASYRTALGAAALRSRGLTALGLAAIVFGLGAVICRLRDTARREHEANVVLARERERETRFFAMTSHEFRTPLSSILSSAQLLLAYSERWDTAHRRTHLVRIEHATRQLSRLHEQIHLLGRAEAGALTPAPSELDLEAFCSELCEALKDVAAGRAIAVRHRGPSGVCLDERLLTHIFGNLLDNALKYSAAGTGIDWDVTVDDQCCCFRICDAGIGIPAADRERLFESFYRASNVGQIAGSGLGLAVVKHAVMAMGGSIELESEPGVGTTFRVRLPRALAAHAERSSRELERLSA
jgi:signal transduction histidine kinase